MPWSAGAVLTAAQLNTYVPQTWTAWSPTITAETGTFSGVSSAGRYINAGKIVHWSLVVTITNAGTAAGAVRIGLPVTSASATAYLGNGRSANSGKALQVFTASASQASVLTYDNVTAITTGHILLLSGTYEAA